MTTVETRGEMVAAIIQAAMMGNAAATFASFVYTATESGEVARHTLILNASTEVLYEKDVVLLEAMLPELKQSGRELEAQAAMMLLNSRRESLSKGVGNNSAWVHGKGNRLNGTYVYPIGLRNIYVHKETGKVYINGLSSDKMIIKPGVYKEVKSAPLTIAKKMISRGLPSHRFRQFTLHNVSTARLRGDTLILDDCDL